MSAPVPTSPSVPTSSGSAPPFHGGRIILTALVAQGLGMGLFSLSAPLMTSLEAEFGASRAALGGGMGIFIVVLTIASAILGPILDRGPLRRIMLLGIAVTWVSILGMSRATSLSQLALLMALASTGIAMYGMIPATVLVVNWFVERRGVAMALAATGMSFAGFSFPPLCAYLIETVGWRDALALIATGAAVLATAVIGAFAVKRPEDVGQFPDGRADSVAPPVLARVPATRFLGDRNFWLMGLGFGISLTAMGAVGTHLVAFGEDLGLSRQSAAWAPSVMSTGALAGKLFAGWMVDRIDRRIVLFALLAAHATGWAILSTEPGFGVMLAGCAVLGFGGGGMIPLPPVFQGACFGRLVIGQVGGLQALIAVPIGAPLPYLVGLSYDRTGSYVSAFLIIIALIALALSLLLLLRLPEIEPGTEPAAS